MDNSKRGKDLLIIFIFILAAGIMLPLFINSPFKIYDHDGAGGCFWGTAARNYARYGFIQTKFGLVENGGTIGPSKFQYNTHHPQLTPVIISFFLKMFGTHEWSIRLPFIIFALWNMVLIYVLAEELWNRKIAALSCLFTLMTPIYLHFSSVSDMVSITLFFSLACIFSYLRWLKTRKNLYLILISISYMLAFLSSYETFYLLPAIIIHNFVTEKNKKIYFLTFFLGFFCACLYVIHTIILSDKYVLIDTIKYGLTYRSGLQEIKHDNLFLLSYIKRMLIWLWFLFTPAVIILSTAILFLKTFLKKSIKSFSNYSFILLLFIFGTARYIFFLNLCYYHPQRMYYLIPALVFSAALAVNAFYEKIKAKKIKFIFNTLFIILFSLNFLYITAPVFFLLENNDTEKSFNIWHNPWQQILSGLNKKYANPFPEFKKFIDEETRKDDVFLTNDWAPHIKFYLDKNVDERPQSIKALQKLLKNGIEQKGHFVFIFIKTPYITTDNKLLLDYLIKNCPDYNSFNYNTFFVFKLT